MSKHTPEHNHFVDGVFRGHGSDNPCARCILEQSAPELLEALKKAEAFINNLPDGGDYELVEGAQTAIAKAEVTP